MKDTLREILRQMGYPCEASRDEDYLTQRGMAQFEGQRVAALHLRMNCDDDLNPFIAQHWKAINTTTAMDRILEQRKDELRKETEKRTRRKAILVR